MARFEFNAVPTVAPSGAPANDYETIAASPAAFGAARAQGLEALGAGAEHAAEAGLSYEQARQALVNETHASELNTWLADRITDRYSQFAKLEGRAAQDALPAFKADLQKLYQEHLDQAGDNQVLRAQLAKNGRFLTDNYYRYGTNHADEQFTHWQDQTSVLRAATYGNQAAIAQQNGDARGMEVALNTSDDEVAKRLEARGFDRDTIAQQVRVNRGHNLKTIIETKADEDPVAASQLYRTYEGQMDAASSLAVKNKLRAGLSTVEGNRIADEETGRIERAGAPTAPVANVPPSFLRAIQREEGFDPVPRWDVKQWTVGYGSHAASPSERPTREELDDRFARNIGGEAAIVDSVNPKLDAGTRAALISLTHNTGDAWTHQTLGEKIRAGDIEGARQAFLQYNNVAGQPNAAIAARRLREASWFGQAEAPAGGGLPDKQLAFDRIVARTATNPTIQTAALARMNQIFAVARQEQLADTAAFRLRLNDSTTEALATGAVAKPITQDEFVRNLGPVQGPQAYDEYQRNVQLGADIRAVASMSPDQVAQLQEKYRPNPGEGFAAAEKRAEIVGQAIKRREDALRGDPLHGKKADPAAFLIGHTDGGGAAWGVFQKRLADPNATPEQHRQDAAIYAAQMTALQEHAGLPADGMRILPKAYTDNVASRLATAAVSDDPQKRQALIAQIAHEAQMWGDRWPQVMREIGGNSLPIVRAIGADVDQAGRPMHPDAMLRLLSLKPTDTPKKLLSDQTAVTESDLKREVATSLAGFRATLMPRQRDQDFPGTEDLAQKLAALHVQDGDSAKVAATKAANELIGDRYEFHDTWRMPKDAGVSGYDVQAGTLAARAALVPSLGPQDYFARNRQFVKPGATEFETKLAPADEQAFRAWVGQNKVPFDPDAKGPQDYDMRGFWKALQAGDPRAKSAVDANDGKLHYPDYWKTPYHQTFSNESQFAGTNAPHWTADDKLVSASGQVIFDDRGVKRGRDIPVQPFADDMGLGAENPQDSVRNIVRDARFVTSPDNRGLNLYYFSQRRGALLPVRDADGKPLMLPWAELARRAPDAPAATYSEGP